MGFPTLEQGGPLHVQRFSDRELALQVRAGEWSEWLVTELGKFRTELQKGEALEPQGLRAVALSEAHAWQWGLEAWLQGFRAGELFSNPEMWEAVYREHGVALPGKIRRWLREGYSCYVNLGKLRGQPNQHKLSAGELQFAEKQADEWVQMGALSEITGAVPSGHIVCNTVVAYRQGRMDRICWAGGPLNEGVKADKFRMENIAVVLRLLRKGDFMFSFDLKKGYFQVPLKQDFQKFALMGVGSRVFQWKVLMFGLSCAPKDFSFIVKSVVGLLRAEGYRICFYIDDVICMAASEAEAVALRERILTLFAKLGFVISWKKSLLGVGQLIRHLGLDICAVDRSVWVPEDKIMAVKDEASCMLRGEGGELTGYRVAALVGRILSWRWACPAGLVLSRGLQ